MRRKRLFYPFIKRFRRSFYKGAEVVNDLLSDFGADYYIRCVCSIKCRPTLPLYLQPQ